jgi:hypothetical protein
MYLMRRWFLIFIKRVWHRLVLTSVELKCKELKTCLLLFLFDNSKFKSIQNHLNPLNKWVNSTSIEERNNSLNEETKNMVFQKNWIPFKLKPTPFKNWKNKWEVHLNFKKPFKKSFTWILKWKINGEKHYRVFF